MSDQPETAAAFGVALRELVKAYTTAAEAIGRVGDARTRYDLAGDLVDHLQDLTDLGAEHRSRRAQELYAYLERERANRPGRKNEPSRPLSLREFGKLIDLSKSRAFQLLHPKPAKPRNRTGNRGGGEHAGTAAAR